MTKIFEHVLRVLLDSIEMIVVALSAGPILWFFGLMGIAPRFEFWTAVYIALWAYMMYATVYEMIRSVFEEEATAR